MGAVTVPALMQIPARAFGDVLNEGVRSLSRVWRVILPPAFGAFVALGVITAVIFRTTGALDAFEILVSDTATLETLTDEELLSALVDLSLAVLVSLLAQALASAFVSLASHRAVVAELSGNPETAAQVSRFAATRFVTLVVASILALVGVVVGLFLLIIPGIWLAGSLSMIAPVIAVEGAGATRALARSASLVRGRWFPTVGFVLLVGMLGAVATQLVQLVAVPMLAVGSIPLGLGLTFVVGVLMQGFVVAAIATVITGWYLDLRTRSETLFTESLS